MWCNDLFQNLQRLAISFFDDRPAGKIVSRVTNDTEAVRNLYDLVLAQFLTSGVYLIAIYLTLFFVEAYFAAICLILLPLFYGIIRFYRRKAGRYNDVIRRKISEINAMINESIQGMRIIQAFGRQRRIAEEFEAINEANYQEERKLLLLESIITHNIVNVIKIVLFAMMLYYFGMKSLRMGDAASIGMMYIFVEYITKIFNQINGIIDRMGNLERAFVASNHVFEMLDEQGEDVRDADMDRFAGKVDFENVSFAYKEDHYVLRNVDFHAEQGQTVGLVGHTGSGKSSVMNLLLRFYDPQQGRILIDGKDIRGIGRQSLRKHMGVVLQDPYLFTGTILSNITLNDPSITREKAEQALLAVGGNRVLRGLEKGLDEKVIEKGNTLSSGQRQLISFARALAYDPSILILDEATSSIDSETEQIIRDAMEVLQRGRTTFIIAHRLSTIKNADQILVLHKGEIVEQGRHDELIALKGRYYRMYQLQSRTEG
ncbi:MAG: ABC transporter ATP-binding protein [Peptostreptococcaceae bacterium]|nr:ABC transporter ATP-binding protein [Peptostreptococcaceae bacterium]